MIYGSVCSGIEAASVAWMPLGWEAAWFAEIDPFCSAILAERYPEVVNLGDFTQIESAAPVDVLVAGTPCQSFSVAGKRAGLRDPRGVLAFELLRLAHRLQPRWIVFENVPGLLSSNGGRDFGAFLGAMADCGYGFAYAVLDARWFGVPQRRRRVFVVGHLGDWRRPAAVLFERKSLRRNPSPGEEAREDVAGTLAGTSPGGGWRTGADEAAAGQLVSRCLSSSAERYDYETETLVADPISANEGRTYSHEGSNNFRLHNVIAFDETQITSPENRTRDLSLATLQSTARPPTVASAGVAPSTVRRLTPRECERLMGLPDAWTRIKYRGRTAADGPRYRAIGSSMAVPVVRWIGERIELVENLMGRSSCTTGSTLQAGPAST